MLSPLPNNDGLGDGVPEQCTTFQWQYEESETSFSEIFVLGHAFVTLK